MEHRMIDISTDRYNGTWYLSPAAMRAMITGKVVWRRCYSCEHGQIWVDGDEGVVVNPSIVGDNEDTRYYQDSCDDCQGVGFIYVEVIK